MVPVKEICERVVYRKSDIEERFTNLMSRQIGKSQDRIQEQNILSDSLFSYSKIKEPVIPSTTDKGITALFKYISH